MTNQAGGLPATGDRELQEPIRHRFLWAGIVALVVAGVPWYVSGGTIDPIVLGLPLWVWIAIGSTLALCGYLHWTIQRRWNLVEDLEERLGHSIAPDTELGPDVPADGPRGM